MTLEQNLARVLKEIEEVSQLARRKRSEISLVAVTKNKSLDEMMAVYECGCRDFGENRVNEALEKIEKMPRDARFHYIGKLQKNKVAKVIGKFALIHSVDSLELAEKISQESEKRGLTTSILLETNTSGEKSKSGLAPNEWKDCFHKLLRLSNLQIEGLMTMAPLTEDEALIRHTFSELAHCREDLSRLFHMPLETLSMGMSNDFHIAIQEGATLLRIGSALFAPR